MIILRSFAHKVLVLLYCMFPALRELVENVRSQSAKQTYGKMVVTTFFVGAIGFMGTLYMFFFMPLWAVESYAWVIPIAFYTVAWGLKIAIRKDYGM